MRNVIDNDNYTRAKINTHDLDIPESPANSITVFKAINWNALSAIAPSAEWN
jgi:hypothetical protein